MSNEMLLRAKYFYLQELHGAFGFEKIGYAIVGNSSKFCRGVLINFAIQMFLEEWFNWLFLEGAKPIKALKLVNSFSWAR